MFVMLIILWTSLSLRKRRYEAFYIIHIVMAVTVLVGVGKHRPDLTTRSLIIILFAAGFWVPDRIVRAARMAISSRGNHATLTALPDGGVRAVLARPLVRAQPGTYALLRFPKSAISRPIRSPSSLPILSSSSSQLRTVSREIYVPMRSRNLGLC